MIMRIFDQKPRMGAEQCKVQVVKGAVNSPHSMRFAMRRAIRHSRRRLECGRFSTAFRTWFVED